MRKTVLWLIRHGEPEEAMRGRCYGRLDAALSAAGCRQIECVAARLSRERLTAIYASPRRRTTASAEIVAKRHAIGVAMEPALREIDFGDFEGRTYEEISTELNIPINSIGAILSRARKKLRSDVKNPPPRIDPKKFQGET